MALTDIQLRNAKPADKDYSITDGQREVLLVIVFSFSNPSI
jgi:hypothetical protein